MDRHLRDVEPFLPIAVVIRRHLEPGLLAAAQKRVEQLVLRRRAVDVHWPVAAAPLVGPVRECLQLSEIRQAMGEVPIR